MVIGNASIHKFVVGQLQARKGEWPAVARDSGVPLRTLEKIARREHRNPRIENVEMLFWHFLSGKSSRIANDLLVLIGAPESSEFGRGVKKHGERQCRQRRTTASRLT